MPETMSEAGHDVFYSSIALLSSFAGMEKMLEENIYREQLIGTAVRDCERILKIDCMGNLFSRFPWGNSNKFVPTDPTTSGRSMER